MKQNNEIKKRQAFDSMFKGKLNPRCSSYCEICDKFYGSKMEDITEDVTVCALFMDDETGEFNDCAHNEIEITEKIYNEHIKELKDHGFIDEEGNETV